MWRFLTKNMVNLPTILWQHINIGPVLWASAQRLFSTRCDYQNIERLFPIRKICGNITKICCLCQFWHMHLDRNIVLFTKGKGKFWLFVLVEKYMNFALYCLKYLPNQCVALRWKKLPIINAKTKSYEQCVAKNFYLWNKKNYHFTTS